MSKHVLFIGDLANDAAPTAIYLSVNDIPRAQVVDMSQVETVGTLQTAISEGMPEAANAKRWLKAYRAMVMGEETTR